MIEAPLEKILADDCSQQASQLLAEMNEAAVMPSELDVMAALRAVAVAFDLAPPVGAGLRIYRRVLGELPLALLNETTEAIIKSYVWPSFPKPAEWTTRGSEGQRAIAQARTMMRIYEQRRRIAVLYYGTRRRDRTASPDDGGFDLN